MPRTGSLPEALPEIHGESAYRALLTHDARFDGHWFVGVTSTGIYCRPVCRVKPPLERHCRFFRNAALAEASGFRPCLRCRPEQAPGLAFVDSSQALALHAARRLTRAAREAESLSMPALAAELGVTDRHLRRIFVATHGVGPVEYLTTQRLLQAKQMLTDTNWPITTVALACGFSSLRRFHAVFADRYRLQPGNWRRAKVTTGMGSPGGSPRSAADAAGACRGELTLRLAYRPPYDRSGVMHFLARRAVPGLEGSSAAGWTRSLALDHEGRRHTGWLEVRLPDSGPVLEATLSPGLVPLMGPLAQRLREAFDLDAEPSLIAPALATLSVPAVPGLRLLGSLDGFEGAARVILGQQVSVAAARTLTARLVEALGDPIQTPFTGIHRLFPTPEAVRDASPDHIGRLGIVRQRVAALQALAGAVADGTLQLRPGAALNAVRERLLALPGIGPWTADLISMRALGWPDAFPARDLGVLAALCGPHREREPRAAQAQAEAKAEAWRPWRSYAVMALWRGLDPPPDAAARLPAAPQTDPRPPMTSSLLHHVRIDTPLGPMLLAATEQGLAGAWFDGQRHHPGAALALAPNPDTGHAVLNAATKQMAEYFAGQRQGFDLPLDPLGGTAFQRSVWQALLAVPFGSTCRYAEIAAACGRPTAVRAVGAAIGRNPISIVVPCHRVIGQSGALTGYAGGLERKAALLRLEGVA